MGTALRFNEESRACAVAYHLAALGHGVLWDSKDSPHIVMTSASKIEVREITKSFSLVDCEWFRRERVDVNIGGVEKCSKAK